MYTTGAWPGCSQNVKFSFFPVVGIKTDRVLPEPETQRFYM